MTASSHRNQSLGPLGGEVELLRNGFPLKSGSCDAIFHETTITSDYEGEYLCRVFFPNNETIQPVESEMRTLNVLGKYVHILYSKVV